MFILSHQNKELISYQGSTTGPNSTCHVTFSLQALRLVYLILSESETSGCERTPAVGWVVCVCVCLCLSRSHQQSRPAGHRHGGHHGHHCGQFVLFLRHSGWVWAKTLICLRAHCKTHGAFQGPVVQCKCVWEPIVRHTMCSSPAVKHRCGWDNAVRHMMPFLTCCKTMRSKTDCKTNWMFRDPL